MQASSRGRPRVQESADDIVAGVLAAAGARVSTAAYTTRRIAELTGLSQTLASRAVRRIRGGLRGRVSSDPASAPDQEGEPLQLAELTVQYPVITLRFEPASSAGARVQAQAFGRRAAAVMAALWVSGAQQWAPAQRESAAQAGRPPTPPAESDVPPSAPRAESVGHPSAPRAKVAETSASGAEFPEISARSLTVRWEPGLGSWQEFLILTAQLLNSCRPSLDSVPGDLLNQLAASADRGLHGLVWHRRTPPHHPIPHFDSNRRVLTDYPFPHTADSDRTGSATSLSTTELIAVALRREMVSSGFTAGDRLSVSLLAQQLGLNQSRVRNAMRQLADDDLLSRSADGFRIPHVSGTDVIDLYACRLQVGTIIMRACASTDRHRLLPARLALSTLEAVAKQGSPTDTGEADLRFQQQLAEASGLHQSARTFHGLTLRLRMFISVLQLDYSPTADRLLTDDRRLLSAVMEGRAEDAVRIWRTKLDDAVRHMSALAPDTVDPRLWSQLIQQPGDHPAPHRAARPRP